MALVLYFQFDFRIIQILFDRAIFLPPSTLLIQSLQHRFLIQMEKVIWNFQQSNQEFVNDLFDKLFKHTDTDMIDLHDDDSCDDHLQFEKLILDF